MNESGVRVAGTLEASEAAVLRVLEARQLFPVSVRGKGRTTAGGKPKRRRVKSADLGMIYSQLADLLGSEGCRCCGLSIPW